MRAAVLRAFGEDLSIEDVSMPDCPVDGVILRVLACGICRSDWHGWRGEDSDVSLGHIGGHEYCGEVVEAGPDATYVVGDRLIAPFILACGTCPACRSGASNTCADERVPGFTEAGAFAEYVAVPRDWNLARLPETISPALAAALGCRVTTAWHALTGRADLRAGEWLAVHGTGGIGLSAALLGRALGARVVVTDTVQEKLDHALSLGVDAAVLADGSSDAIHEITGGGAHVSVEALGIPATLAASISCLRMLGRHVQVGMPAGGDGTQSVDVMAVYRKNLALYGTRGMPAWRYPSLLSLIEGGQVDLEPLVTRRVSLSDTGRELSMFDAPAPPGVAVITDFQS